MAADLLLITVSVIIQDYHKAKLMRYAMRKIPLLFGGVASGRGGLLREKLTAEKTSLPASDRPEAGLLYIRHSVTLRRTAASVIWTCYG